MKLNVALSITAVISNCSIEQFVEQFCKLQNNQSFIATTTRKIQCYIDLKEKRPYRISVFKFNEIESEKHFSFERLSETILNTFLSKSDNSEALGFVKHVELVTDEAIELEETKEDEEPGYEAEDCQSCKEQSEESGYEYEANFHKSYGHWYCDNCNQM